MSNVTLELAIENEIEEAFGIETGTFNGDDLEAITDGLKNEDEIEWMLISDPPEYIAYKHVDGHRGFGFYLFESPNEISKEDLIDLIIEIEDAYQLTKDKVRFDE